MYKKIKNIGSENQNVTLDPFRSFTVIYTNATLNIEYQLIILSCFLDTLI